ncbi:RNA polymerase sigma factor [Salinarimonas ramus]|uniref:DNA-directed RNA polymerase sigma-70 factor n=1 Tax=Salinarimonas ramus TaxID=690164 RepID=A0A917QKU0_9HYPH|nr:RNA polymerase sigma factor [Salinarimonas ramus]GGK55588.1 DNA-directed RNA polymerase sigma-70 factor [Salinarimonas ramus]
MSRAPAEPTVDDLDAFGRALVALVPNLRRYALSLCRSRDIADDLVQSACERALAGRDGFEPGTRMDAWLLRILRNVWIDRFRKVRTEGVPVGIDAAFDLAGEDGARTGESRLLLDAAGRAIMNLPDEQREVLLLVCVEELSYREAAATLDIPIGTVMSRLARARLRLAADLGLGAATGRPDDTKEARQ